MKNLLYLATVVCLSVTICACSEKEEEWKGDTSKVKLVRSIIDSEGGKMVLEYDEKNRITQFGDYTLSYNGNTVTILNTRSHDNYTCICTLNSSGYATEVVVSYDDGLEGRHGEHTYDKNGYLIHCKEAWDGDSADNWSFDWTNGNLTSISGRWDTKFTYGDTVNTPINLNLFYITDDYGCEDGSLLGFLGFLGRQNKNLPTVSKYDDGDTLSYKYEFNADGTVAKVRYGSVNIEFYY